MWCSPALCMALLALLTVSGGKANASQETARQSRPQALIGGETAYLYPDKLKKLVLQKVEHSRRFKVLELKGDLNYVNAELNGVWTGGFEYLENSAERMDEWRSIEVETKGAFRNRLKKKITFLSAI